MEHAAKGFNADILADLIERATGRAFRAGVDAVTADVLHRAVTEVTKAHAADMA